MNRFLSLLAVLAVSLSGTLYASEQVPSKTPGKSADHSKFPILQQEFKDGQQVTEACLSCHTETGKHFMQTLHWKWTYNHPVTGQELGKNHVINGFCGNAVSNWGDCTECHASYGYKDETFNFNDPTQIDCLVCHDTTGTYYREKQDPRHEANAKWHKAKGPVPFEEAALSVGLPRRENCGTCHFYGGGGDGVKHGDLDSSLVHPSRTLDVHMDENGLNFSCTACHTTVQHQIAGSRYHTNVQDAAAAHALPGMARTTATCMSCHGETPHPKNTFVGIKLNNHTQRVACQTCHIPEFARGGVATKVAWDWSKAGKLDENGKPFHVDDYTQGDGTKRHTYLSKKGEFTWDEDVVPSYAWFNGEMAYTTVDQVINPSQTVSINHFEGSATDGTSRIWPFKVMHTRQPYDTVHNTLVYTHVWGDEETQYWGQYEWLKAITTAMKVGNRPFSGKFDFVNTEMYWPITHMVAPKEDALSCAACHSPQGRLENVAGVYLPGRDRTPWNLSVWGDYLLLLAFMGIVVHALLRIILNKKGSDHDAE